jgi:hypothetical protein
MYTKLQYLVQVSGQINWFYAEVAELVDALGSGSSEGSLIGVRVPASAP